MLLNSFSLAWTLVVRDAVAKISSEYFSKLVQSALLKFMKVFFEAGIFFISVVSLIKMGRWFKPRVVFTAQVQVSRRLGVAILMSGDVLLVAVTLVGMSSLRTPRSVSPIHLPNVRPLSSSASSVSSRGCGGRWGPRG